METETAVAPADISELMKAIHAARQDMPEIGKSGKNSFDNYTYSTLVDYLASVLKGTNKHNLVVWCEVLDVEYITTTSEKMKNGSRVKVEVTVYHTPSGQSKSILSVGEAWDKGDKAVYKAVTGARKYALQLLFNLYGEDDPEVDSVPDEGGSKPQTAPKTKTTSKKDTPKTVPGVQSKDSEPEVESLEVWIQRIDAKEKPADLLTFITGKMLKDAGLSRTPDVFCGAFDHVAKRIYQGGATYKPLEEKFATGYAAIWKGKLKACKTAAGFKTRLEYLLGCEALFLNEPLFRDLFAFMGDLLNNSKWAEVDELRTIINEVYQRYDLQFQSNEVFGK